MGDDAPNAGTQTHYLNKEEEFRVEVPRFHLTGPFVLPTLTIDPYEDDEEPGMLH